MHLIIYPVRMQFDNQIFMLIINSANCSLAINKNHLEFLYYVYALIFNRFISHKIKEDKGIYLSTSIMHISKTACFRSLYVLDDRSKLND